MADSRTTTRRRVLRLGAASTGLAVAGCLGDDDNGDDPAADDDQGVDPVVESDDEENGADNGTVDQDDDKAEEPQPDLPEAQATDWPMYRADRENTGRNDRTVGPTDAVAADWIFQTDAEVRSSPAVANEQVFVGSDDGHLYAIDRATGEEQWAVETGGPIRSSPAYLLGTVYVGSDDHTVYAIDAETGEQRWTLTTDGKVRSSPNVSEDFDGHFDELVGIGSHDEYLYLIDALEGDLYDRWPSEGEIIVKPCFRKHEHEHGGTDAFYYWGTLEGIFHNHRVPIDGDPRPRTVVGPIRSSMTWTDFGERTFFYGDDDGVLHVASDYPEWMTFHTDAPIRTSPAHHRLGGIVFIGNDAGTVYAVDLSLDKVEERTEIAEDLGEAIWSHDTDGSVRSSPALVRDTLYIGSDDSQVYGLAIDDGSVRWEYATEGEVRSSPAVSEGSVFIGSDDGSVYALSEE